MDTVIRGTIAKITFFADDSNYGIVKIRLCEDLKVDELIGVDLLTVKSFFDHYPQINEQFEFYGKLVINTYGLQFSATKSEQIIENTSQAIISYLSSKSFKGVGKSAAEKIYKQLGNNCLKLIEDNPEILNSVKGLNSNQKKVIKDEITLSKLNRESTLKLLGLGLSMSTSLKLIKELGINAYDIIKINPYALIYKVDGFGFKKADSIALKLGIRKNSYTRIQELALFLINEYTFSTGNTYIEKSDLISKIIGYINEEEMLVEKEDVEKVLINLSSDKKIFINQLDYIFDTFLYKCELYISDFIHYKLDHVSDGFTEEEINKVINELANLSSFTYSEEQLLAIKTSLQKNLVIITGGPGTGKSTIIKAILSSYGKLYGNDIVLEEVYLLAPTGRASKRLATITNHQAMTIHKFLGYEGNSIFKYGINEKRFAKVVIIDEFSMVDVALCYRLFSALENDTKIVIVGDKDQLPSINPGNVLGDLIKSSEVPVITLNRIYRQENHSSITELAYQVNNGMLVENLLEKQIDRNFIKLNDGQIIDGIVKTIKQGLNKNMNLIDDIQVLVPMYKSDLGIDRINEELQNVFNSSYNYQVIHNKNKFRINDKVIQLRNRSEKGVMNGDIGFIININRNHEGFLSLDVQYDFGIVNYLKEDLEDLSLAYAISIHKSQGSEFKLVIIPFSMKYYIMLKRKLIYTAITRAKKYLVLLGNVNALSFGVKSVEENRRTFLYYLLVNNYNTKKIDDELSAFDEVIENMENLSPYDFLEFDNNNNA